VKRYQLKIFKSTHKVTIYTLKEVNSKLSETDKFIGRFQGNKDHKESFEIIIEFLDRILNFGSLDRFFRNEANAIAIPAHPCSLRLYGFKISDGVLVLGNGGVKTSRTVQESRDCLPHFNLMRGFGKVYIAKRKAGRTEVNQKIIVGDKTYFLEL
jgi:hypothetical protein